jgi:hypothetical protein
MNRLAIFVEGKTEVLFTEKLLLEIAGEHKIRIETRRITGGTSARRRSMLIQAAKPDTGQKYFVLIVDCSGDRMVKGRIMEEHENLTRAGYQNIIGIRDVRPEFTFADLPRLEASLPRYIRTSLIPVEFVLAVMEVEAWFLGETTHFSRIDPTITLPAITTALGFDLASGDIQSRAAPADDLNTCYAIGGKTYQKRHTQLQATVDAIDYAIVYCDLGKRFPHLGRFIACIDAFLT